VAPVVQSAASAGASAHTPLGAAARGVNEAYQAFLVSEQQQRLSGVRYVGCAVVIGAVAHARCCGEGCRVINERTKSTFAS
jgi:hypothetical protein